MLHQQILAARVQEDHVGAGHPGRGGGDGHQQRLPRRQPDAGAVHRAGEDPEARRGQDQDQDVQGEVAAVVVVLQSHQGPGEAPLHEPDDRHLVYGLLTHARRGWHHADRLPPETVQHQASLFRKHENENMIVLGGDQQNITIINTPGLSLLSALFLPFLV